MIPFLTVGQTPITERTFQMARIKRNWIHALVPFATCCTFGDDAGRPIKIFPLNLYNWTSSFPSHDIDTVISSSPITSTTMGLWK